MGRKRIRPLTDFGVRVKQAAREKRLSLRKLAAKVGIENTYIHRMLDGRVVPQEHYYAIFAKHLDVSGEWLRYGAEECRKEHAGEDVDGLTATVESSLTPDQRELVDRFAKLLARGGPAAQALLIKLAIHGMRT